MLHPMEDFRVGKVLAFMNVRLSDLVGGLIVQVFGSKSSSVDGCITRIAFADEMLFRELHAIHLLSCSPFLIRSPKTVTDPPLFS
jgi:hypothetical protein